MQENADCNKNIKIGVNGMENYVDVLNVTQSFHGRKVLDNVTVSFCEGKIHGVIGNNGSGKTVLFKTICGFLTPQKGEVYVRGQRVGKDFDFPPDIGALIESPGFLPNEDAYHTLAHLWSMRGKPDYVQIEKTLHMVGLSDVGKKKVGNFSLGMRQRLGIAQAIMCNPSLLILDEPFNGLDKQGVQEIHNVLLDMNKNGCTIILTSHNEQDIASLCATVHEMDGGKISSVR